MSPNDAPAIRAPRSAPAADAPADRRALRRWLRARRRAVRGVPRIEAEAAVARQIVAHPWFDAANRILAYRAFDGEVALDAVVRAARAAGKQVLFARPSPDAPLRFVVPWRWRALRSGCPVPDGPCCPYRAGDLMLVPGVGFTPRGDRLGMGGGHYDRTLAHGPVRALGVAFACQLVPQLPAGPWDRPVDAVVTQAGWCAAPVLRSA